MDESKALNDRGLIYNKSFVLLPDFYLPNLEACIMAPDFLVHEAADVVGVVVVEGLKANQEITGWIMKEDETVTIKIISDIPIGHKVALQDLAEGDTVIKYNTDIGKVVAPIKKGEHLHVHNVKTKRW